MSDLPLLNYDALSAQLSSAMEATDTSEPVMLFLQTLSAELDRLTPSFRSRVISLDDQAVLIAKALKTLPKQDIPAPSMVAVSTASPSGSLAEHLSVIKELQIPSDIFEPAAMDLLTKTIAVADGVDALRRCVVSNCITTISLARKVDAISRVSVQSEILSELRQQSWVTSSALPALSAKVIGLTKAILGCSNLPAAASVQCSSAPCPICLERTESPIMLLCAHRFCWSCLVSARAVGLQSCPVCRADQTLDLHHFALEPILVPIFRATFPTTASSLSNLAPRVGSTLNSPPMTPLCEPTAAPALKGAAIPETVPMTQAKADRIDALTNIGTIPALSVQTPVKPSPRLRPLNPLAPSFVPGCSPSFSPVPAAATGMRIIYTIADLMSMRPLNPNAPAFVPYGYAYSSPFALPGDLVYEEDDVCYMEDLSLAALEEASISGADEFAFLEKSFQKFGKSAKTATMTPSQPTIDSRILEKKSMSPPQSGGRRRASSGFGKNYIHAPAPSKSKFFGAKETKVDPDDKWGALGRQRAVSCV